MKTFAFTRMSIRPVFAMLMAVALLFVPLATPGRSAMAMAPTEHHAQVMESHLCGAQPATDDHAWAPGRSCCVAICAGLAIAPSGAGGAQEFASVSESAALDIFYDSFLAELPTPPPRFA